MKKYVQPGYNERGEEIPDPTPVEVPLGFRQDRTLQEDIQRMIRQEMSNFAQEHGAETFEEADDFYVEDEEVWTSPYELTELQEEHVHEVKGVQEGSGQDGVGKPGSEEIGRAGDRVGGGVVAEGDGKRGVGGQEVDTKAAKAAT